MMSNNKQSSVELFIEQLEEKGKAYEETIGCRTVNICIDVSDYMELKQQAKAMHKEELEFAFKGGMSLVEGHLWKPIDKFEEFYNQKFNNEQTN